MFHYKPLNPVTWLSPCVLFRTIYELYKSSKLADRREENIYFPRGFIDYKKSEVTPDDEFWVDFVADTGDGFNETLTILHKVVNDIEVIKTTDGKLYEKLKSGNLLLFGGDMVYPTASIKEYRNRFLGPFFTAQEISSGNERTKEIHAIPGNHDWYDGLYSFQEIFCAPRSIGNYKTKQSNSYGAIRITDDIWIWMLDIQLSEDFNTIQIKYFTDLCNKFELFDSDEDIQCWNIILCIAQPFWLQKIIDPGDKLYTIVEHFIMELFVNYNPYHVESKTRVLKLKTILTGDIHNYSRFTIDYKSELTTLLMKNSYDNPVKGINEELNLFTFGGGGAYTFPTHNLDAKMLTKSVWEDLGNFEMEMKKIYPSPEESKDEAPKVIYNVLNKNASFILFCLIVNSIFILLFTNYSSILHPNIGLSIASSSYKFLKLLILICAHILFYYLLANSLDKYFKSISTKNTLGWLLMILLVYLVNVITLYGGLILYKNVIGHFKIFSLYGSIPVFCLILLACSVINMYVFGLYIYISNLIFMIHDNELFSISQINKFKNFCRIKITRNKITIYPIGIDKVDKSLINKYKKGQTEELIHRLKNTHLKLIEKPIEININPFT